MNDSYRFIPASPAWVDAITRFFSDLKANRDDQTFHPHPFTRLAAEKIASQTGRDVYLLMVAASEVVGYGMLRGWDEGYAVPSLALAIAPSHRGCGLGRMFLEYLHEQASARGAQKVRLKTYPSNHRALSLYESSGYRFSGKKNEQLVGFMDLHSPRIYVSSSCARVEHISDAVNEIVSHGIQNIELSGGTQQYPGINEDLLRIKAECKTRYLLHNYFPPSSEPFVLNIASCNRSIQEQSLLFVKDSLETASLLQSPLYALHPGYRNDMVLDSSGEYFIPTGEPAKKEDALDILEQSVRTLCKEAEGYGMMFGVENLFPGAEDNFSLLCTETEIDWLFRRCADIRNLGLLIDLGHAKISAHLIGFDRDAFIDALVEKYAGKILGLHISDNHGKTDDHLMPEKDNWMLRFIKRHHLQRVPITIEARNARLQDISAYCRYLSAALGADDE